MVLCLLWLHAGTASTCNTWACLIVQITQIEGWGSWLRARDATKSSFWMYLDATRLVMGRNSEWSAKRKLLCMHWHLNTRRRQLRVHTYSTHKVEPHRKNQLKLTLTHSIIAYQSFWQCLPGKQEVESHGFVALCVCWVETFEMEEWDCTPQKPYHSLAEHWRFVLVSNILENH